MTFASKAARFVRDTAKMPMSKVTSNYGKAKAGAEAAAKKRSKVKVSPMNQSWREKAKSNKFQYGRMERQSKIRGRLKKIESAYSADAKHYQRVGQAKMFGPVIAAGAGVGLAYSVGKRSERKKSNG